MYQSVCKFEGRIEDEVTLTIKKSMVFQEVNLI